MKTSPSPEEQVNLPLTTSSTWNDDESDLDTDGIIPNRSASHSTLFTRLWRNLPASWPVERDPEVAIRHLGTLLGFITLCIFVFSVPSLLYLVAPRAPAPPGTSPNLDEGASMISGTNGAVAADHPACSEVGVGVMKNGGNSVDALVGAMLCQGILSPFASGIGGGAFIMVYDARRGLSRFYDARETAPSQASMEMFEKGGERFGGKAVAVPGELRGLFEAHREFGRLDWADVVQAAVEVGETAKVGAFLAVKLRQMNETIMASESLSSVFTKKVLTKRARAEKDAAAGVEVAGVRGVIDALGDGVVQDANDEDVHGASPRAVEGNATYKVVLLEEGDKLVNERLLETLRAVGKSGPDAFYVALAGNVSEEIREAGGVVTKEDISSYRVRIGQPLTSFYQGFRILGAPLPSTGGASIAMALNMITELQFRSKGRNGVTYSLFIETLKWVFAERMSLGDPEFVAGARGRVRKMLSRREALTRVYKIDGSKTYSADHYCDKISTSSLEDGTSHISILDKDGIAVSATSTINLPFGAGILSKSSGAILNDQMDAFATHGNRVNAFGLYPSFENYVEAGKRPLSSMCPTIVLRGDEPYLIVGGSGGPKAISGVLLTMLNILDFGDWLGDGISAPRVHHQLVPNVVSIEAANGTDCRRTEGLKQDDEEGGDWRYWSSVCEKLGAMGHKIEGPAVHGAVQGILAPADEDRKMFAASDPRRAGKAAAF